MGTLDRLVFILPVFAAFTLWNVAVGADGNGSRKAWLTKPASNIDAFYNTDPLGPGQPGELLRYKPWDGSGLPYNISAAKILYRSRSARGLDVPASGIVLLPMGTPPNGGWPIIAWAHPFLGVARGCAPSLMTGFYTTDFLSMYVNLGYAIVAPDYAGLGTASRNAAFDFRSNATDLIYSTRAAKSALPQLSGKWVGVGVRDGGLTALIANEEESTIADQGYLGSIAIDAPLDPKVTVESSYQESQDVFAFLAYGLKTLSPDFDVRRILSTDALADYHDIDNVCFPTAASHAPGPRTVRPGWDDDPAVSRLFGRNRLGEMRARAPSLILTATRTPLKPAEKQSITRMCAQRDIVDLESYDVSVDDLVGESASSQISWISARFKGLTPPNICHK